MADFYYARRAGEPVAAAGAFAAKDDAGVAQLAENGIEKFLRNVVRFGDFARLRRRPRLELGEVGERLQAVLPFAVSMASFMFKEEVE
jgi:hypothetical protein